MADADSSITHPFSADPPQADQRVSFHGKHELHNKAVALFAPAVRKAPKHSKHDQRQHRNPDSQQIRPRACGKADA
jgi:hypothetical protein